ncbi:MAG: elongation factor Ts [Firmicutes bacterium]|nr:elongation factor Ts [Bacillota bacterium]
MAVTAAMIKELREITGVGMSTCKEALVEADGNIEKAIEILREKGLATAAKKAGRVAAEGLSYAYINGNTGVVVEVNSETDFVAKNEKFRTFVENVAKQACDESFADLDAFMASAWALDSSKTVKDELTEMISVIGENLNIRRVEKFEGAADSVLVSYLHAGGKVAVLLEMTGDIKGDAVVEAGKNVCMQIAAMNPRFVSQADISEEFKKKEIEILTQQAKNDPKNANKPDNVIEKMIQGRLSKEFKEMCLVDQEYVKGDKESVKQYVDSVAKEQGGKLELKRFIRFETGEGIEKKEENFAEEVSKAMKG